MVSTAYVMVVVLIAVAMFGFVYAVVNEALLQLHSMAVELGVDDTYLMTIARLLPVLFLIGIGLWAWVNGQRRHGGEE